MTGYGKGQPWTTLPTFTERQLSMIEQSDLHIYTSIYEVFKKEMVQIIMY